WSVNAIEKRQSTRLEIKCSRYKNYSYLRYRNTEKCWTWSAQRMNYSDAIKSCQ
ncbi:hypothetical protein BgiMline_026546, partial [Biomphalaria glabrata]